MPGLVTSAEALQKFCLRALEYIDAARRHRDVTPRFLDTDPWSAEWTDVANEHEVACADLRAAEHRLKSCLDESGGEARYGQPEGVSSSLREIRLALLQREGYIFAEPDRLPCLKERIESLLDAAIAFSSRRDARDLAKDGFERATSGDLHKRGISTGRLEDMAGRALQDGIIVDYRFDLAGKLWVRWKNPRPGHLEPGTNSADSRRRHGPDADHR
jgi:hypothetical protein